MKTIKIQGDKEVWKDDLKTYRSIETWSAALFLGAISLYWRQILEWKITSSDSAGTVLVSWYSLSPAVIGLFGSLFLLVVNQRGREVRTFLDSRPNVPKRACLGWLFFLMPLSSGVAVSFMLEAELWQLIIVIGAATVLAVLAWRYDCHKEQSVKYVYN